MSVLVKSGGVLAVISVFAAPALVAQKKGWTIYQPPEMVEAADKPTSECEDLDARACTAERSFARQYDPNAPAALKVGEILDRDQPRFTTIDGSAVERPPEGEVYVIWERHLVRIIEGTREITKIYFNAL